MTITNGYTTLVAYKLRFMDGDTTDHEDDPVLEKVIEAASRAIDNICSRRFYPTTETRYFTAEEDTLIKLHTDLISVTTLKTDTDGDRTYENTWDTGDYDLVPYNAALDGWPYNAIEITPYSNYYFPYVRKGVEVAGSFGFCSTTPPVIEEACLLAAHRLMKRTSTPLGVSAAAAVGQMSLVIKELKGDPDVMGLLITFMPKT